MRRFKKDYTNPFNWNLVAATCGIDFETSVKNKGEHAVGNMAASPYHPDNVVVWAGLVNNELYNSRKPDESTVFTWKEEELLGLIKDGFLREEIHITLVGHNIKFDLLYLIKTIVKYYSFQKAMDVIGNIKVWDTMVVDYLLSGQQHQVPSLDKVSKQYRLPLKNSKLKQYWDEGVDTEDIPEDEIVPYLKQDVLNAFTIFRMQYEKAWNMEMLPLIHDQMELLVSLTIMEYNGMHVDVKTLAEDMNDLMLKCNKLEEALYTMLPDVNPDSPTQLSAYFYGGKRKFQVEEDVLDSEGNPVYYKTGLKKGLKKTHKVTKEETLVPQLPELLRRALEQKGIKNTSEEALRYILEYRGTLYTWIREYLEILLDYREKTKEFKTYYVGVGNLVWPHDDCVHGNLNMAVTATGRLASSAPNMQNMPSYSGD